MTTCTFSTMACCWVGVVNVLANVQRLPAVLLCGFLPFCCGSLHWRLVRLAVTWQCAPASPKPPAFPPPAGLFTLSLVAAAEERHLLAALLFAVLLNLKHIFLYAAPAFFVYLLRRYCRYCLQ